ncbi:hypothetical protein [Parabacteroides sp.]
MKSNKKNRTATHSRPAPLIKCLLCGEVLKLTKWKKHIARFHDIICESGFHNYFCVLDTGIKIKDKCKCRLCGAIIKPSEWKYHLICSHNVGESPQFHQFFISVDLDINAAQEKWYNPDSSTLHSVPCGTKINGGPEAKVIFNATFSNRKKF